MSTLGTKGLSSQIFGSANTGLLLLRLGVGIGMVALHGWGKLTGAIGYLFGGQEWKFIGGVEALGFPLPVVFAVAAALAESLGAVLVAVGLFTRPAAIALAFTMLVAVYRHLSQGQGAELASFYLLASVALILIGPGVHSADARLAVSKAPSSASRNPATAWLLGRSS